MFVFLCLSVAAMVLLMTSMVTVIWRKLPSGGFFGPAALFGGLLCFAMASVPTIGFGSIIGLTMLSAIYPPWTGGLKRFFGTGSIVLADAALVGVILWLGFYLVRAIGATHKPQEVAEPSVSEPEATEPIPCHCYANDGQGIYIASDQCPAHGGAAYTPPAVRL